MSSNLSFPNRSQFLASFNQNQPFSFPNSINYYISKNPSTAKLYRKMIQSCKYFFIKNPILVISELLYVNNGWKAQFYDVTSSRIVYEKFMNMNFNIPSRKIWILERLHFCQSKNMILLSSVAENIYCCKVTSLCVEGQTISYDELLILSSNVEKLVLEKVVVTYDDGSVVPFETIVKACPKIKTIINTDFQSIFTQTFTELLKIPQFLTLDKCELKEIPEDFDIESFYTYMKKNKSTKFWLEFSDSISEVYEIRWEEIIDEILEEKNRNYQPPYISFHEMNYLKNKKLLRIF